MPTYDEMRVDCQAAMGHELGTLYHLLWNECAKLCIRWDEFVELFGKDQEQFEIMNAVAPGFFRSVQNALWESILLNLCRFADRDEVAHRKTLSLAALLKCSESQAVPDLHGLVIDAQSKIRFAQDWRHRSIAHLDLEFARDRNAKPLAHASRRQVREALEAIVKVLNAIEWRFSKSRTVYGGTGRWWGGSYLLRELKLVESLREERKLRVETGVPRDDDFDYKKWH